MLHPPQFLFVTCQVGAEAAAKSELARNYPPAKLAYSRPGFLTFKLPEQHLLPEDFDLRLVFARACGFSLGKIIVTDADAAGRAVWQLVGERPVRRVHVWPRDAMAPGERDFEPSITAAALDVRQRIVAHGSRPELLAGPADVPLEAAQPGEWVLDCVVVQPNEWWIGYHVAKSLPSRWPGGMMPLLLPPDAVSRAWLKMEEGLRWSQLPIPLGARVAELGSAPGGASQALLARGLKVTGIDPAEMHPAVLASPGFTHVRKRVHQVRRREFRRIHWLTADMNVAPQYTLDTVEAIVTHPEVKIRGMLLTLKLFEWKLAEEVPQYLERVRQWGYDVVQARQLQHNRQEICLAALRKSPARQSPPSPPS